MPLNSNLISVVLPTYNGEKYIRQSIESVINQTFQNWELIVIDDCSTDATNHIIAEYVARDSRIHLYRNEMNQRLPMSLNIGFRKTKGDYLTWTSDDNIFLENSFDLFIHYFETYPEISFAFSKMTFINANGNIKSDETHMPVDMNELKYHNIIGASFMYKRCVYQTIGEYNPEKYLVEDYDYWLRIARTYTIAYIPNSLYLYRQHEGSLTESKNLAMLAKKIELYEGELKEVPLMPKHIQAAVYNELAITALGLDDFDKMKKYIQEFRRTSVAAVKLDKKVVIANLLGKRGIHFIKVVKRKMHTKGHI